MSGENLTERIDQEVKGIGDSQTKKPFTDPKLTFIEPKLTKHGDATKITAGFFGEFYPG